MIRDIDYLKPENENNVKHFFDFASDLSRASQGKGCFSVTIYSGFEMLVAESILNYLKPFDKRKKLFPIGGYLWLINIEYIIDSSVQNPLAWYSDNVQLRHTIKIICAEPV